MLYLYAITDLPDLPTDLTEPGLDGAGLREIVWEDLAAVVSSTTDGAALPTESNLWRHEAVVEALMAARAVLPVRFGTMLLDEDAAREILAANSGVFTPNLEHVRGRVEVGLKVLWNEEGVATSGVPRATESDNGRSYMLARVAEERALGIVRKRAETLSADLHSVLVGLAADSRRHTLATPRLLLTAEYLVGRNQIDAFRGQVDSLSADHPALRFLCTGPWPPYSFVTASVRVPEAVDGQRAAFESERMPPATVR